MRLAETDFRQFARDGYIVVRDVVTQPLLEAADIEIDAFVAEAPDGGDLGAGPQLWFPPVARLPACDALLQAAVLDVARELVAPNGLGHAFDHIQVAMTVPPYIHTPGGPHIDGHGPGQDPPHSFTMLAGVLLTDQSRPATGNLWVWPGSHVAHSRLFGARGTRVLQQTGGHSTLLDPPLRLRPAVEVKGKRGDVILAHFLLGHNKGGNTADHVRRTIYYRLSVPGHASRWESTFLDPWTEYPSVGRRARAHRVRHR